jgi:WD40 repeat protein
MRMIFTGLVLLVLISFSPVLGKSDSCLDSFRDFKPIEVKANPAHPFDDYDSVISMAWYGECILAGSTNGLWLYDIHQPEKPIMLAHLSDRAISYIAVNPHNMMIAFNLFHESTVYFISPDQMVSTWNAQNQSIRDISFSPDGSLMVVASAKITDTETEYGLNYDSIVQILDASRNVVMSIPSDLDSSAPETIVTQAIFSEDNKHLFTYNLRQGYDSDKVTYWDVGTGKKVWNYDDLFRNLKRIPDTDPLYITDASMSNRIAALGGRDGVQDWDDYYGTAVHLWDVTTQQRLGYFVVSRRGKGPDEPLTDLTLNHDGSILVTGQSNGAVRFWNTKNVSEMTGSVQVRYSISQLLYDATDRYLAIRDGNEVVVWDIEMNIPISTFDTTQLH